MRTVNGRSRSDDNVSTVDEAAFAVSVLPTQAGEGATVPGRLTRRVARSLRAAGGFSTVMKQRLVRQAISGSRITPPSGHAAHASRETSGGNMSVITTLSKASSSINGQTITVLFTAC